MPIVFLPELPQDTWSLTEWLEKVAGEKPGGDGTHSLQSSDETIVITIPMNKVRSAIQQILGWAWADDAAPYLLHREAVAIQHPVCPWLWADAVTVTPHNPLAVMQPSGLVQAKTEGVGYAGYAPADTTRYTLADLTVRFRNIWWQQWPDWSPTWQAMYVGKEWIRSFGNVSKSTQLDLITAEGAGDDASMFFADGNTSQGVVSGLNGTKFQGTQFVRSQKTIFKLVWKNVPINYTCGEVQFSENEIQSFLMPYPKRLIAALGRVNSTPFPGTNSAYVAGTLLLTGIEEQMYQQPVRTDSDFGLLAADYTFTFEQFDPERDPDAVPDPGPPGTGSVEPERGHNLVPNRNTRKWYLVTSGTSGIVSGTRGSYQGNRLIPSCDFHHMFRHVDNGAYSIP